jgi:hypothetical protein
MPIRREMSTKTRQNIDHRLHRITQMAREIEGAELRDGIYGQADTRIQPLLNLSTEIALEDEEDERRCLSPGQRAVFSFRP